MTAFQKSMICFGITIACIYFFPWSKPDMTVVYPDNCAFTFDAIFSKTKQLEIKSFIDEAYKKSKNPSRLLSKIESHFSEIKSIIIDMQNPEVLNFKIQAYEPIFVVNHEFVVCQFGKIFPKLIFAGNVVAKLEDISYQGVLNSKNIDRLIKFFEALTDPILKDFSIRWIDKQAIWLDQKQGQDLSLLVGYEYVPTLHDVAQCRKIQGQASKIPCKDKRGRPCKNNMTWVCDLRFDQQIVLFSTNKGV